MQDRSSHTRASRVRRAQSECRRHGAGPEEPLAASSYVNDMRNVPPSHASNACTWLVMPVGTFHFAIAVGSRSARLMRFVLTYNLLSEASTKTQVSLREPSELGA